MSKVLLFGGGLQSISLARSLKDFKNEVYNIADKTDVGRYSFYIDNFTPIELEKFCIEKLIRYIKIFNIEIIIPTEDEYAEWLSVNKQNINLSSNVKLAIVDNEIFQRVIDKEKLLKLCEKFNIPHPHTEGLENGCVYGNKTLISYPALIKPNISNGSRGICIVNSDEELRQKASGLITEFGSCTVQEFIENDHYYNVMLYRYKDGSWGPEVATRITRFYPIKGGSSSFCTTIHNENLFQPCKLLLEKLNWTGFADFDVVEKGVGDFRIIELNPRVPASVHAAYVSGINYGQIIVEDLLKQNKMQMQYNPGEHLRFLGLDIAWFLSSPERFKAKPSWFKFYGKHLHYQEGGIKDIKAMLYSIWSGIKKQMSPEFRKAKSGMNG